MIDRAARNGNADADPETADAGGDDSQRLDKWLWFARVVKSRTLAAGLVTDGKVRIDGERTLKPSQKVKPGDVVTVTAHHRVRVLRIKAAGTRRGPPSEASALYEDLSPPPPPRDPVEAAGDGRSGPAATRDAGSGRPTKKDRRATDRLRSEPED